MATALDKDNPLGVEAIAGVRMDLKTVLLTSCVCLLFLLSFATTAFDDHVRDILGEVQSARSVEYGK